MSDDLVGKVAICSRGRVGLITGRKTLPWGESWIGVGLDNGTQWASREPRVLTREEIERLGEAAPSPVRLPGDHTGGA